MRDLSAPVALSRKITGDDRHRWSYIYEWTSDQGLERALKPPLQSLCGWRRNAQTCLSWSNDQLSSAFTAPAARLSSRTVRQNQKWSPELPYSSRTGPAQQRADDAAKSPPPHHCNPVAGASDFVSRPAARLCRPQGWAARRAGQATPGVRHFGVRATYVPTLPISHFVLFSAILTAFFCSN